MNRPPSFLRGRLVFVFVVLMFLTSGKLFAQTTIARQLVDQYVTSPYNTSTYGLTWLPTDYASNPTKKYPLIIFLHGSGEGGDGVGGLWTLASQGLPMTIGNGWDPEAVNPADGQNYKFIVVSPQAPSSYHWSYGFPALQYIIPDVLSRYRVDLSRVYVTGLSAGGSGTYSCVTNGLAFAQKIAAVVPVCPAGANTPQEFDQLPMVGGTYGVKVWSPVGANDALLSWAQLAVNNINGGSPSPSIPAVVDAIPGVGHEPAGWNRAYDPTWRSNSKNLNIYEWMLKYTRNGNGNTNQAPVSNAGADQTITLPVSSAQLNGSGSDPDGTISSYNWTQVTGPSTASFSNTTISNPSVSNLIAGSYIFRLTVTDNGNFSVSDDVVINVNPAVTSTTLPGRVQAEAYASMFGIQTENTSDAGGGQNVAWQDDNDWMNYSVNVTTTGVYNVNFRVATQFNGAQFQLRKADGTTLATINVPNTGNFQTWQTVSANVNLSAGQQTLRIYTTYANGGWNFNWFEFAQAAVNQLPSVSAGNTQTITLPSSSVTLNGTATDADGSIASYAWSQVSGPSTATFSSASSASTGVSSLVQGSYVFRLKATDNSGGSSTSDVTVTVNAAPVATGSQRIEAEAYSSMYGIQLENTSDAGGGQNVAWQDNNDWMDYSVNVASAGTYNVSFRVASMFSGAQFQLRNASGSVLATVTVPNTGNFQSWQTVSASVSLPAGSQTLRVVTTQANGGWNFNWFDLGSNSATPPPPAATTTRIEAENYSGMYGIQTENTSDAGGGQNVAWQDNNDWMDYNVNVASSGTYTVNFRVASMFTGAQFQLRNASGSALATVTVPNTGNFQTWQTVSATVNLSAGQQTLRIYTTQANGGWNFNWFELTSSGSTPPPAATTTKIEAENYSSMYGIQTETTSDAGGGQNIGWQDNNDWMDYSVNIASAGTYTVNFRVASMFSGAQFQLRNAAGSTLATVTVPNTGSFQSWQTVSASVTLPAGQQTLRVYTTNANGGWNFNWFEITNVATQTVRTQATAEEVTEVTNLNVEVYPNPVTDRIILNVSNELTGKMTVQLFNAAGSVQKQINLTKSAAGIIQSHLSLTDLPKGNYILKVTMGTWNETRKIIKL